jgi:hypothetical protein
MKMMKPLEDKAISFFSKEIKQRLAQADAYSKQTLNSHHEMIRWSDDLEGAVASNLRRGNHKGCRLRLGIEREVISRLIRVS